MSTNPAPVPQDHHGSDLRPNNVTSDNHVAPEHLPNLPRHELTELLMANIPKSPHDPKAREYVDHILRNLNLMGQLVDALRLCRNCMVRSRANQWAKYCYAPCVPERHPLPQIADPPESRPRHFDNPPSVHDLIAEIERREQADQS